jgi:hypothetical protein
MEKSFADELRERIEEKGDIVLYFLIIKERGLRFPLHKSPLSYRKFFVVPGMVLGVTGIKRKSLVCHWRGPALETDLKISSVDEYSEDRSFIVEIPIKCLLDESVVKIDDSDVVKMADHVPAVVY